MPARIGESSGEALTLYVKGFLEGSSALCNLRLWFRFGLLIKSSFLLVVKFFTCYFGGEIDFPTMIELLRDEMLS